jgi:hypothetical protein
MALKLSERLAKYRTEGHLIDEWVNDELVREAERLEAVEEKILQSASPTNSDYTKFSGSDIKNAFVSGYEQGHNDTVESCYGCSKEKAIDYLEEPENFA